MDIKKVGVFYASNKYSDSQGCYRKMKWMQQEEVTLSRARFLKLFFAATMAGLSLLSLAGCGGSQGGDGRDDNGNKKKDHEDHGGGGGY